MKRILQIIHGLSLGGSVTFIYNLLQGLDRTKYKVDILIQDPNIRHERIKSLVEERGGRIILITDFRENLVKHILDLKKVLSVSYDIVHIHINSLINPFPFIIAKKYSDRVIVHSHNTKNGSGGLLGYFLHKINTYLFLKSSQITRIACGIDAGKWMFKNEPFKVIDNAVDLSLYYPSDNDRKDVREELKVSKSFVIGQIGRLDKIKNQKFTIDLLAEYVHSHADLDVKVVFIGEGPLKEDLVRYADKSGVLKNIIFTGGVQNPHLYLQAFDCLVLPSLFEGFAFVAVEAQASGLPVLASDKNTRDINITGTVQFLKLELSKQNWINSLDKIRKGIDRQVIAAKLNNTKYDIRRMIKLVEEEYSKLPVG